MSSKVNILYIFHVSSIGGGSFCLLNMVKRLDKQLFCPIVLLKEDGPLRSELEKLGATVYFEKTISIVPYNSSIFKIESLKQFISILFSIGKVKNWILKTNAEIVHINTMMMYPYLLPVNKLGKKSVIHIREHWPENEHRFQLRCAQKTIQRYANKIIAINKTSAKIIGLTDKTQVIYDWIDFENRDKKVDFTKLFGRDVDKFKIFLFLGGTIWLKGALEVVEVFSSKIASKDARLLLVGCDTKELDFVGIRGFLKKILGFFNYHTYTHKVKLLAQKDDRIIFISSTYHVKSLIEQSFCLVSFFTIPHANLPIAESTWLGKPSISAHTPEAIEYGSKSKAALFFEMYNKDDFKVKILYALNNVELINKYALDGKSNVQEKFDPKTNSDLLNNIYSNLLI
jgi:glycosyltransferase involved in cell wall biosynthesis